MIAALAAAVAGRPAPTAAADMATRMADAGARLLAAYPDQLARVDGNDLVWKDGTRMPIDDGRGAKAHAAWLAAPDLEDMFAKTYVRPAPGTSPPRDHDPGRARASAFFDKMYGDCTRGEVARHLVDVVWLPRKWGKTLKVTRINGVAERLKAVSAVLDLLPAAFDAFLVPSEGTYVCRPIAGTNRVSAHGHGIAIDIATPRADYWQWTVGAAKAGSPISYRNRIPPEIVAAFEAQGFIWGGAWYHYDTMHFEYRPELLIRR